MRVDLILMVEDQIQEMVAELITTRQTTHRMSTAVMGITTLMEDTALDIVQRLVRVIPVTRAAQVTQVAQVTRAVEGTLVVVVEVVVAQVVVDTR